MTIVLSVFVSCLLLTGFASDAFSLDDPLRSYNMGTDSREAALFEGFGRNASPLAADCSDLARTKTFRSKGLEYAGGREFAEAVRAVAIGASMYSPEEIPASWRDDAERWIGYFEGLPAERAHSMRSNAPFEGVEACIPALLSLASMEYRNKPGHEDAPLVLPQDVRAAIREARVVADMDAAGPIAERAAAIGFKIAVAERMGAGECEKTELEGAKLLLERARNVASSSRSNAVWPELLDKADRSADALLANRQYAFLLGEVCTPHAK